ARWARSAVLTLTGISEFSVDNSGNYTAQNLWDTRGVSAFGLWTINGPFGGAFINGPSTANLGVNLPLNDGTYTLSFHGHPGPDSGRFGMNLFFNGNTSLPGISVFAPTAVSNGTPPSYLPIPTFGSTPSLQGSVTPTLTNGAGIVSFQTGGHVISLSSY